MCPADWLCRPILCSFHGKLPGQVSLPKEPAVLLSCHIYSTCAAHACGTATSPPTTQAYAPRSHHPPPRLLPRRPPSPKPISSPPPSCPDNGQGYIYTIKVNAFTSGRDCAAWEQKRKDLYLQVSRRLHYGVNGQRARRLVLAHRSVLEHSTHCRKPGDGARLPGILFCTCDHYAKPYPLCRLSTSWQGTAPSSLSTCRASLPAA